jgi:hypothetical protein
MLAFCALESGDALCDPEPISRPNALLAILKAHSSKSIWSESGHSSARMSRWTIRALDKVANFNHDINFVWPLFKSPASCFAIDTSLNISPI